MRIGAITKHTKSVLLGVAKVFCGVSSDFIYEDSLVFDYNSDNSVGALASAEFSFSSDYQEIPVLGQNEMKLIPIKDSAQLTVALQEITITNLALSLGLDPFSSSYVDILEGTIPLGTGSDPFELRVEAVCVYPDQESYMAVIFPRAIARVSTSVAPSNDDNAKMSVVFESRYADVKHNGSVVWDDKPLGAIIFSTFNA